MKRLIVLLGAALLMSACGIAETVDGLVDQSVFSMDVGLCFDDEPDAGEEVSTVPDRDCEDPHDNEVFALFQLDDGPFPGTDEVNDRAMELCTGSAFEDYVGIPYQNSKLGVFPFTPTEAGWDDGDQEVVCALYHIDLEKLTGSMQGSSF